MLLKMGALIPWLQYAPDGQVVKQRNGVVRRTYDLGRVVKSECRFYFCIQNEHNAYNTEKGTRRLQEDVL